MTATKTRSAWIIRTPSGVITGYREVWKDWAGRPVFSWRHDKDEPPFDFGSYEEAFSFKVAIWCCASTKREVAERDTWIIEEVSEEA